MVGLTLSQNTILRVISKFDMTINNLIEGLFKVNPPNDTIQVSNNTNNGKGSGNKHDGKPDLGLDCNIHDLVDLPPKRDLGFEVNTNNFDRDTATTLAKLNALYIQKELAYSDLSMTFDLQRQIIQLFR